MERVSTRTLLSQRQPLSFYQQDSRNLNISRDCPLYFGKIKKVIVVVSTIPRNPIFPNSYGMMYINDIHSFGLSHIRQADGTSKRIRFFLFYDITINTPPLLPVMTTTPTVSFWTRPRWPTRQVSPGLASPPFCVHLNRDIRYVGRRWQAFAETCQTRPRVKVSKVPRVRKIYTDSARTRGRGVHPPRRTAIASESHRK